MLSVIIMESSSYEPIIIENLSKHARMTIEEIFIQYGIIISECFCETWQSSGWNFLECCFVGFMTNSTHVEHHPVLRITQDIIHAFLLLIMPFLCAPRLDLVASVDLFLCCAFFTFFLFAYPNVLSRPFTWLSRVFIYYSRKTAAVAAFQFCLNSHVAEAIDTMAPRHTIKSTAKSTRFFCCRWCPFSVRKNGWRKHKAEEQRKAAVKKTSKPNTMLRLWVGVLRQMWTIKNPFRTFSSLLVIRSW